MNSSINKSRSINFWNLHRVKLLFDWFYHLYGAKSTLILAFFAVQDEATQVNGIILVGDLRDMGMNHVKNFDRNYAKIMGALMQV